MTVLFCSAVRKACFMYSVHSQLSALISLVTSLLQLCCFHHFLPASEIRLVLLPGVPSFSSLDLCILPTLFSVSVFTRTRIEIAKKCTPPPPPIAALNFWGTVSITTSCLRKYKYNVGLVEIVNFKRLQKKCAECPAVTEFRRRSVEHLGTKLVVTSKTNPMPRTSLPSNSRQNISKV